MRVQFSVFIEGENGRHIEMPITAICLEDLDKTIARNYNNYQDLRRDILNYNNNKYIIPITQYPEIKMITYDGKNQRTENYKPIYDYINSKKVVSKVYEIINSNPKEKYPSDFPKQNIAKDIKYIVSKNKDLSYEVIRELYLKLKKLGEIKKEDLLEEELIFNKEKYQIIINSFESKALVCINSQEFPYVYSLKEKIKQMLNKPNIEKEDVILIDKLVDELMSYCQIVKSKRKK